MNAVSGAPSISVILCTRNRADYLEKALASLAAQDFAAADEVILVDNASTDRTPEIARRFETDLPLSYLREARIGLCVARNTGWRAARGDIVAYFDDDAIARPGWLAAIRAVFSRPDAGRIGVVGGRVAPIWQAPRPAWLPDSVAGSLTIVDWGGAEKVIPDLDREWLVGANMAIPRRVLEEVGGFHPSLDRIGNNLLSGGDIFLQKQIAARGYACLYLPAMAIEHVVPAARLGRGWFLRRYYWQGVSDAVMHLIECAPSRGGRLRAAAGRMRRLLRNRRRMLSLVRPAATPERFALKCFAFLDLGFILGLLGAARR